MGPAGHPLPGMVLAIPQMNAVQRVEQVKALVQQDLASAVFVRSIHLWTMLLILL